MKSKPPVAGLDGEDISTLLELMAPLPYVFKKKDISCFSKNLPDNK